MDVLAIDLLYTVYQQNSRHNAKARSMGVGRDISYIYICCNHT